MAKGSAVSRTFVWILLGLLIIGLAGFGATGLSGTVRSVGSVGDKPIPITSYARALQGEIRAIEAQTRQPLTFQQAQAAQVPQRVLSQLVTATALEHEAAEMGLSIGDENLSRQLMELPGLQGPDGRFDRANYAFALEREGLSEAEFEADLRDESARALLQGAVLSGYQMPDIYAATLLEWWGERRNFTWTELDASYLPAPIEDPDNAALERFHQDNIADYTRPETRQITFAWVTPDMLRDTIQIDEAGLRELYDSRADEYNRPERRLVERLAFSDNAAAEAAKASLDAGDTSFETLVADRGLELSDTDLGDVARDDLEDATAEAVFAADVGSVIGPLPSDLGPALFRLNAVLDAQVTSFDEAREDLTREISFDRARRIILDQASSYDDLLAGGATLEDLAKETDLALGQIGWTQSSDTDIAAYAEFAAAAAAAQPGDFPEMLELSDGGVFALRLDAIEPPRPEPLDEVHAQVLADWRTIETGQALTATAKELADPLSEGKTFAALDLAPRIETEMLRRSFVDTAPADLIAQVFEMDLGEVRTLTDQGRAILVRLDNIQPVDLGSDDNQVLLTSVQEQTTAQVSQDLFRALAEDIQRRAGISIDQNALNAVHTQFHQ